MKGKRFCALLLTLLLLAAPGLSGRALAADWTQFLGGGSVAGVTQADAASDVAALSLRWERNTGSTWNDVPGTPVAVGGYVYYYSSQYLRKVELATGREVAKAQVYGKPVNQFFIQIACDGDKVFVPCQVDNLGETETQTCFLRVYDADTLEQLYVTEPLGNGQTQSPVSVHDGVFLTGTYGRNGVYAAFSTADDDPARPDEKKAPLWTVKAVGRYGFSNAGAAFVGERCYFGCANVLFAVKTQSGEAASLELDGEYVIHSTPVYDAAAKRLYVSASHRSEGAAVLSFALDGDGLPVRETMRVWHSGLASGGTQSAPVVYAGRLYLAGGGTTMGSSEPFHVLDAETLTELYTVPVLSKSSASVTAAWATEENGGEVCLYLLPYAPNEAGESELWLVKDRAGQTEPNVQILTPAGRVQYCSQSVTIAGDGSLLWYNDAGWLYCYENTAGLFADTRAHWARETVAFLARRGIVNGVAVDRFDPEGTITRAEFVQLLYKLSGAEAEGKPAPFADVTAQDWFAPAVSWAAESGVLPAGEERFFPLEPIVREDMALLLWRFGRTAGLTLPAKEAALTFTDAAAIAPGAREAVEALQRCGIFNGQPDGAGVKFAPAACSTRAEAAAVIARFFPFVNGEE